MKNKCQNCSERATLHITEIEDDGYQELHLCYKCAQKYLQEPENGAAKEQAAAEAAATPSGPKKSCPVCRITFDDFKASGRLGCPHDYEAFREELRPLLESIHGGLRHTGKVPRRLPADTRRQTELIQLRQEMQQAIAVEDYERAARLRDRIEGLEQQPQ